MNLKTKKIGSVKLNKFVLLLLLIINFLLSCSSDFVIIGVNTNKSTFVLERIDSLSTQIGYKSYPFQGEEFTTKKPVSSESLRGKYVLLDFWATWCKPCIQEFPFLKELYATTDKTKFEIVGIVGGGSPPDILTEVVERYELTWPQILSDETNNITKTYGVRGYPMVLLLDTEGFIIAKNLKGKALEEKIISLMKE